MKQMTQESGANYAFLSEVTKEQLGVFATAIFERVGYFTSPGEGLTVHGIDFIVYKPDLSEPEIALRCRPDFGEVSARDVSSFWTKITSQGYGRGIYVTNLTVSPGAFAFAEQRDLLLVDAKGLESGIEALPPKHRKAILKVVEPIRKTAGSASAADVEEPVTFGSPFLQSDPSKAWEGPKADKAESAFSSPFSSPFSAAPTEEEQWLPKPKFEREIYSVPTGDEWKEPEKNSGRITTMVAALCPVSIILSGFLIWDPLMGGGDQAGEEESFVAPVVSQYIKATETGADFELVAEMMKAPEVNSATP